MELLQQDITILSGVTTENHKPVYNSTTLPLASEDRGHYIKTPPPSPIDEDYVLKPFSNLAAHESVDLQFRDIAYTVSMGFRQEKKEILHKICGKFAGGQLIAIMGPSGAGKSTLLDVLSGYKETGVEGTVYLNGRVRNLNSFRKMSCYITQEDRIQPLLTVLENMKIAAELKISNSVKKHEKLARIEDILTVLGLYEHQYTLSGQLSGGQRKRLSIALELVNNPTIMFLDEPTTGLDAHSCTQVVELCKQLAKQGRTIICTIHQPSAKLFQEFDQVYVLSQGNCLYQGSVDRIVPFFQHVDLPCPKYHNPADYIIELACIEFGQEAVDKLVVAMSNGDCLDWFSDPKKILKLEQLRQKHPLTEKSVKSTPGLEATSQMHQVKILLRRGLIKMKRDATLTHLRIGVNIAIALMLGTLYVNAGNDGMRVLDNYNLLFAILMHHLMTTLMLTVLTFPIEMAILLKENFNRWYSLKAYYASVTILDTPLSLFCCLLFTVIIYFMTGQPLEVERFAMFFTISILIVLVAQSIGLMIGAWFSVVNGTFLAPTLAIPMMMFAGFGVTLRDLPSYLKWGSHISYLRYGLEGYIGAIYGMNRTQLDCTGIYCHYKYPKQFMEDISMRGDQFWNDVIALVFTTVLLRVLAYFFLKWKTISVR